MLDLDQFTGSETFYKHALVPCVRYTQGVQYVAKTAGAYWLLDYIATMQLEEKFRAEEFQVWNLEVKDGSAVLITEDGNDREIDRDEISFTDFPEPGITLWFTDNTILLPSEY